MPKLSVLLPVFNAEGTIARAAQSCVNQTFKDLELILINDGSRDNTERICRNLEQKDPRIKLMNLGENQGVARAVEAGRQAANGEFLARMDADDYSYPHRFMRQIEFLEAQPSLAACGSGVRLLEAPKTDPGRGFLSYVNWVNSLNNPDEIAAQRFIDSPIANPTSMLRSKSLDAIGGFSNPTWAEDYDLWLTFMDNQMRLANVGEVLLDWYDSPKRLTRSSNRYSLQLFSKAKAHYLARVPTVRRCGVLIAGAGPIGKRLAKDLQNEGVHVSRFYELNEKKIGQTIHDVPVHGYAGLSYQSEVLIGAVCRPGAREEIRALAGSRGFTEGTTFFCVA